MSPESLPLIRPEWPTPDGIHAAFTLRQGGVSEAPFDTLNVGTHVGDRPEAVAENRARIGRALELPAAPAWLEQVHGIDVLNLDHVHSSLRADASFTRRPDRVCAIQVADCMPVLFAACDGSAVAAAHAGWRGLAGGVLEATVKALDIPPQNLIAWLGPAIGPTRFEVGDEVREAFLSQSRAQTSVAADAFESNERGRWWCDLHALGRLRLSALGIRSIHAGDWCTHTDAGRFFSYRRDGQCGRMTALIWLT